MSCSARPHRLAVRTWPSQGQNTGSIPVGAIPRTSSRCKNRNSDNAISFSCPGCMLLTPGSELWRDLNASPSVPKGVRLAAKILRFPIEELSFDICAGCGKRRPPDVKGCCFYVFGECASCHHDLCESCSGRSE